MITTKEIFAKAGSGYVALVKESKSPYTHFYTLDSQQAIKGLTTTDGIEEYLKELRKQRVLTNFPISRQCFQGAIHRLSYSSVTVISDGVITKILG